MKRIVNLLLVLAFAVAAVSCDPVNPDPSPEPIGKDPFLNCVVPESVKAGGEAQIQWDGFKQNASLVLVGMDGKEYKMTVKVITAYGLTFKVPVNTPEGLYNLVLVQGERTGLGEITVTPADMPVTGLKVPTGAKQGESFVIEGVGFEEGCSVIAADQNGKETTLETEFSYSGLTVTVPADFTEGTYSLYLLQDEMRWLLTSAFSVYKDVVEKSLERIDFYTEYSGTQLFKVTWEISRETPVTLMVSESVVDGETVELSAYDKYVQDEAGVFTLTVDGLEVSNNVKMSYTKDEEGKVVVADVLRIGKKESTPFTWTYDSDGFLTDVSSPKFSLCSYEYENGNMTVFGNTAFEYSNATLVNNPAAPDVIWGFMSLVNLDEPFMYVPYFLGWYTKASAQLPTAMLQPSATGTGTDRYPITYEFDEDGYVVKMSWGTEWVEYGFTSASN